jgi:tetratricopeptide (TPR) repeat protein
MQDIRSRKLTPIYNAIEGGNYSKGANLCLKKDVANWDTTKALLSYCYSNLNRKDEALLLAQEVIGRKPTDDATLFPLKLTLKSLQAYDAMITLYESVLEANPSNLKMSEELFFTYVRKDEPKQMQLLAQKLYKQTGSARYLFWAVTSMLCQGPEGAEVTLKLAEMMLKKTLFKPNGDSRGITSEKAEPGWEEAELYYEVLMRQGCQKEAVTVLTELRERSSKASETSEDQSNSGKPPVETNGGDMPVMLFDEDHFKDNPGAVRMHSVHFDLLRANGILGFLSNLSQKTTDASSERDTAQILETQSEVTSIWKSLLSREPDLWQAYDGLIGSVFDFVPQIDDWASQLSEAVKHQKYFCQLQNEHSKLRGPFLSELKLLCGLLTRQGSKTISGWVSSAPPLEFADSLLSVSTFVSSSSSQAVPPSPPPSSSVTSTPSVGQEMLGSLIANYADRFASKPCCFSDLRPSIEQTDQTIRSALRSWSLSRAACERESLLEMLAKSPSAVQAREACCSALTRFCKFHQIAAFCQDINANCQDMGKGHDYLDLLYLFLETQPLCTGGIGGDREVQPGDEILLLLSTRHRSTVRNKNKAIGLTTEMPKEDRGCVQRLTAWASLSSLGMTLSEHNYAHPLECLEPARGLAAGRFALDSYNKLGVKHVQVLLFFHFVVCAVSYSSILLLVLFGSCTVLAMKRTILPREIL